jgi:hypothetical protein
MPPGYVGVCREPPRVPRECRVCLDYLPSYAFGLRCHMGNRGLATTGQISKEYLRVLIYTLPSNVGINRIQRGCKRIGVSILPVYTPQIHHIVKGYVGGFWTILFQSTPSPDSTKDISRERLILVIKRDSTAEFTLSGATSRTNSHVIHGWPHKYIRFQSAAGFARTISAVILRPRDNFDQFHGRPGCSTTWLKAIHVEITGQSQEMSGFAWMKSNVAGGWSDNNERFRRCTWSRINASSTRGFVETALQSHGKLGFDRIVSGSLVYENPALIISLAFESNTQPSST